MQLQSRSLQQQEKGHRHFFQVGDHMPALSEWPEARDTLRVNTDPFNNWGPGVGKCQSLQSPQSQSDRTRLASICQQGQDLYQPE